MNLKIFKMRLLTSHRSQGADILREYSPSPHVACQMSDVMCHVSNVTCHGSPVTYFFTWMTWTFPKACLTNPIIYYMGMINRRNLVTYGIGILSKRNLTNYGRKISQNFLGYSYQKKNKGIKTTLWFDSILSSFIKHHAFGIIY